MTIPKLVYQFIEHSNLDDTDLNSVRDWVKGSIVNIQNLTRQIKRQEFEFRTILEASNVIHARAVDNANPKSSLNHQIKFLINTAKGYLGIADIRILTNNSHEGVMQDFTSTNIPFNFAVKHDFIEALTSELSLVLSHPSEAFKNSQSELNALLNFKYEVVVPLLAETGLRDIRLEGAICFGRKINGEDFANSSLSFMSLLGSLLGTAIHNAELHQRSIVDSLTQVFTRGYFDMYLKKEVERYHLLKQNPSFHAKNNYGFAILMLDVDKFKNFNDKYGHQVGDEVLCILGKVLRSAVRHNDVVSRYGGEEFVVLAPAANLQDAGELAERIRSKIEANPVRVNGKDITITASFGVSSFPAHTTDLVKIVQYADEALYKAKSNGRNRVELYS